MRSGVAAGRGLLIGAELVLGLACKGQSAKGHATTCLAERVYDIAGLRSLAVGGYQLCHRDSVLSDDYALARCHCLKQAGQVRLCLKGTD